MRTFKHMYEQGKRKLLQTATVNQENREIFRKFFLHEEYKLQRQNDLRELDEGCYKTLYGYVYRFRKVNAWFHNKPWTQLTRDDIQRVYDDLEDGRLRNQAGLPYRSTEHYYNKVFKSKPFELAGKLQLAREVIQFPKRKRNVVRYVTEENFRRLVSGITRPQHLLLLWLAWDIGENILALLQLQKKDFTRGVDPYSKEPEYLVNLPEAKIKRSRQTRTEPTLYPETVRYCDLVLGGLSDDDRVFSFGYDQARKIIRVAAQMTSAQCMPNGERVRWKDLRSGMACHLLSKGWQPHEVNLRLGHTPNSDTLNAYVNFLAIDRHVPKRKLYESDLEVLQVRLDEAKQHERLARGRIHAQLDQSSSLKQENAQLRVELGEMQAQVRELAETVERLISPSAEAT